MQPIPRNYFSGTIGVFDSGIGGLSVANAVSGLLPAESMLYVADNARAPYGPQPAENILAYSQEITRFLLAAGAKLIVVACNTATSIAIDALREGFPEVPFVGLEPAVKPASTGERVGVLATAATLASPRYHALRARYLPERPVLEDPCLGLVPLIEREAPGSLLLRDKLESILAPMLAAGIDTLVLGCTHYPMVLEDIQAVCGPGVRVIDPSPAAARQVQRLLVERGLGLPLLSPFGGRGDVLTPPFGGPGGSTCGRAHHFFTTGSSLPLQRSLLRLPELNAGRREVVPWFRFANE
ncbi:glutamate racemase [Neolewinella lacunae]|uniref:Glutamate racemase n=1 Tax=Neolewinella lacunae TaxID=1517758 RepID=A0A923PEH8_9BACT|nr:glutamate racemase [Neolewinella lacunae]MBC6992633.1 glutamate racemase [Neolewinella lacunae]MDN3633512.1 glutamate racemase [Neolewinella lacunae]